MRRRALCKRLMGNAISGLGFSAPKTRNAEVRHLEAMKMRPMPIWNIAPPFSALYNTR